MKNKKRIFWYVIAAVIIIMQLYPFPRPEISENNPDDLLKTAEVPENIASMLRSACYDCHSNETVYPWYANIAPVKWWLYDHINEGREDLNFSEWNSFSKSDKAEMLDDISTEVSEGEMPLKSYPLTHPGAKLSDADREALTDWAEEYMEQLYE